MAVFRRPRLVPGIYDEPLTARAQAELHHFLEAANATSLPIDGGVVAALETTLGEAVSLALQHTARAKPNQAPKDAAEACVALAGKVLSLLKAECGDSFPAPAEFAFTNTWLREIRPVNGGPVQRPRGSLHAASLLANAPGEPLLDHLRSEFDSADRVDLLCAFVKLSGVEKLRSALERHTSTRGRPMRVLTTTYMGASDAAAVERLAALHHTEVKVSFDEQSTRLHAKAWIFYRANGYSTAYVGSSNLSHAAQTDGLEWNVRVTEQGQPALFAQMAETFEQYWGDRHQFEPFHPGEPRHTARLWRALSAEGRGAGAVLSMYEIEAKDFQKPILEELQEARALGRNRNLLVAATGTGKTIMAALDYRNLRRSGEVDSLLYVAHRKEILEKARHDFRQVLQETSFGELWVDGERPQIGRHVFASIQTLTLADGGALDAQRFDHVIIDEAHHTAAQSWDTLVERLTPKQLVGLTGTPERADGLDYEQHFPRPWVGNLRVWNAIPHALVPFRYYMLDVEGVDLHDVAWVQGRYATEHLAGRLITAADMFVRRAVRALAEQVARPDQLRAIAFCANKAHVAEVQRLLAQQGLRAVALTDETDRRVRQSARADLDAGRIQVLCVVDIYNEGVDVPNVNALFFFRPTESATVFLQQLGRGLRRSHSKAELVVFDLTGRQHHQFRFDRRLRALLGHTPRELQQFVETGFGRLPAGCHFDFAERARQQVLEQIRRSIPSVFRDIVRLFRELGQPDIGLAAFLHETDVEIADLYDNKHSWTELRQQAGVLKTPLAAGEAESLANLGKLLHVGDPLRLEVWRTAAQLKPAVEPIKQRLQNMLFAVLFGRIEAASPDAWERWQSYKQLRGEVAALAGVLASRNAVLVHPHRPLPDVPLVLHGRYLGVELSAAFDDRSAKGDFRQYYKGVEQVANKRFDLLFVTMQKADEVKEHLRYRDFPLSETMFHWQSQAATTQASKQGQRHLQPAQNGLTPLLFVRETEKIGGKQTAAYVYVGPVEPASFHGERPISIEWRLAYPMPTALVDAGRIAA